MKLFKTKIDDEIYYYYLKDEEKRFMYRHKYRDSLGKRKEKKKSGFKTEKRALRSLLEVKADILNNGSKHIENDNMTVSQWVDIWYESYNHSWKVSTVKQRKQVIDNHIKPLLGHYKLSKLDKPTYIREFVQKLLQVHKSSTVQNRHTVFNIAVNAAVENDIIPRNRLNNIPFERQKRKDNFLTPVELNTFLNYSKIHLDPTRYTMVLTLAYTGVRHGELLGLKWKDIDIDNKTITIERTRDENGEREPKTNNSYRTIIIDDVLIQGLSKYRTWCISTKLKYGMQLDKKNDHIFISEENEPCSREILRTTFRNMYNLITDDKINIREITPHGMRHSHATILITNGIPAKTVSDRLGNSVEMIYKTYTHSFQEMEEKAVSIFTEMVNFGAKTGAN